MDGTNTFTISILRKTVFDRAKLGAYYAGESVKGELKEVAAMLQASSDDDDVLNDFFDEGNTELANILQKYVGRTKIESSGSAATTAALFTIKSVANFNDNNISGLTNSMYDYLVDFMLKEWTKPIPNTAAFYEEKIKEDTQAIRELSCHRMKPSR